MMKESSNQEGLFLVMISCDVLVVGGGAGGTAAALRATAMGRSVILTEETRWLGGQLTSQGVSALDEHEHIERFGGTAAYNQFRRSVRDHYRQHHGMTGNNPGNGWVSRLCYEPKVGVAVIDEMLRPAREAGLLTVLYETVPVSVERDGDLIRSVTVRKIGGAPSELEGDFIRIQANAVVDATELGDLLPLADIPYRTGMESFAETGEPSAPAVGNPEAVQSFTFPFAVEYRPGESHVIPKPEGYEAFRDSQPFSFNGYTMFETGGPIGLPFWTYRRLVDAGALTGFPNDIAMINWPGNDYHGANLIDKAPAEQARVLDEARRLSLSFLYWLQTGAPRDDGGQGYPELLLRPDVMGTDHGLSQYPYIRESRRLKAYETVREQDIVVAWNPASRARLRPDSAGLGLYIFVDVHRCCNSDLTPGNLQKMRPFQIPVGALLSPTVKNLVAGNKNLGLTHITNGAFRLHPTEWNAGESAGALAAFAVAHSTTPSAIYHNRDDLRRYQKALVDHGIPLYWFIDVEPAHPAFAAVQWLAAGGIITGDAADLLFRPDEPVAEADAAEWTKRAGASEVKPEPGETRAAFALRLADVLTTA
jgi:hypothetical protein